MSSVRLCDRCQQVFSEIEDGWETFQVTRIDEDDDGRKVTKTESRDSCPRCAFTSPPKGLRRNERIENLLEQVLESNVIPALSAGADLDQRERELRIAEREKELGIGPFAPLSEAPLERPTPAAASRPETLTSGEGGGEDETHSAPAPADPLPQQ